MTGLRALLAGFFVLAPLGPTSLQRAAKQLVLLSCDLLFELCEFQLKLLDRLLAFEVRLISAFDDILAQILRNYIVR